jgi:hypothetical protein
MTEPLLGKPLAERPPDQFFVIDDQERGVHGMPAWGKFPLAAKDFVVSGRFRRTGPEGSNFLAGPRLTRAAASMAPPARR